MSGSEGEIIGMAQVLHVYPGDKVQLEVYAKYTDPQADETQVAAFIAEMAMSAFDVTPPPGGQETLASNAFQSSTLFGNGPWLTNGTIDEDIPKGRLNFILFDRDFVPVDWGFKQVSEAAFEDGTNETVQGKPHERIAFDEISVPVAGYLFVYVSNENEKVVDIYFDDLKVTHTHSPLQQVTDYYPFGAVANTSWTRETAVGNPYLYNAGSELNEKTAWYETALRSYDPYLGRFNGVDPMADKYAGTTPFNYAFNSPAVLNDPTGAEPGQLIRTDDTPWEAPAYTRGKYQYYDNFAGWAAGNQWWSGGIDRSWSSAGNFYGKFGPGDGGALTSFMKGVLAGSRAARERREAVWALSRLMEFGSNSEFNFAHWNTSMGNSIAYANIQPIAQKQDQLLASADPVAIGGATGIVIGLGEAIAEGIAIGASGIAASLASLASAVVPLAMVFTLTGDSERNIKFSLTLGTIAEGTASLTGHSIVGLGAGGFDQYFHLERINGGRNAKFSFVDQARLTLFRAEGMMFHSKRINREQFLNANEAVLGLMSLGINEYNFTSNNCVTAASTVLAGAGYYSINMWPSQLHSWFVSQP